MCRLKSFLVLLGLLTLMAPAHSWTSKGDGEMTAKSMMKATFKMCDKNRNREISLKEYKVCVSKGNALSASSVRSEFNSLDVDQNGRLSRDELLQSYVATGFAP